MGNSFNFDKQYYGGVLISISQRRERKTNEIIDAAEKVFFSQGFDKTTMENIAAELELTKPALYRYFKNKIDLYYAVILRGTRILSEMMEREVELKNTGLEKILATGTAYCKFYKKYPDYSRLMIMPKTDNQINKDCINLQKLSEYDKNHLKIMCDAIEIGKQDKTIRNDIDTFMTALYLIESTTAIILLSERLDEPFKTLNKNGEDFIQHSLMLMRNSLDNKKIRGE
ncbi:MAG: TetR/AcrR family transcriptional regulator [Methanobacterium sp.]|uniref:TetR/AcrR family transcriptional regulator n=2 Tax=Methanobacterium sp. TaxID=2164 RepID=UPI003C7084B5